MMIRRLMSLGVIVAAALQINAQSKTAPHTQAHAAKKSSSTQTSEPASEGDRVFRQNCSRCHNAPEGFSPRISGTI